MADEREAQAASEEAEDTATEAVAIAEDAEETAEAAVEAVVEESAILEALALRIAALEEAMTSHSHEHEHAKPEEPGEEADLGEERIKPKQRSALHRLPSWAL